MTGIVSPNDLFAIRHSRQNAAFKVQKPLFLPPFFVFFCVQGVQFFRNNNRSTENSKSNGLLEFIFLVLGLLWWIGGAITAMIYGQRADDRGLDHEAARTAVWALSWVNVGLLSLLILTHIWKWCTSRRKPATAPPPIYFAHPPPTMGTTSGAPPPPLVADGQSGQGGYLPYYSGGQFAQSYPYQTVTVGQNQPPPSSPFISNRPGVEGGAYGGYPIATEPPAFR